MSKKANKCTCLHCGYSWIKRISIRPKACPDCKRRNWDQPLRKHENAVDRLQS